MAHTSIDFVKIRDIAYKGVRRAAAFMGLGINAARDENFKNYQLINVSLFQALPTNLGDKDIDHIKTEFEKWVVSNGLREIIESFGLFLDRVHSTCLLMATSKHIISNEDAIKFGPAFERKGVEGKLQKLRNRFEISTDKEKYFSSINQARNCITHRWGRVGPEDLRNEKSFRLIWRGIDIYAETSRGEKYSLMPPFPIDGIKLEGKADVKLHFVERECEYNIGDIVTLSPNDLADICQLVYMATDDIVKSTIEYSKKIGIAFAEEKPTA